tara:strand:- start:2771 stop:2998 length:228 start_codon:yes stop_codon:yes gene_type:complete
MSKEKATYLVNKALANPSLVKNMPEDTFFKFVLGIAKYDKTKAMQLEKLKPFTTSQNKAIFWEAVGILMPSDNFN